MSRRYGIPPQERLRIRAALALKRSLSIHPSSANCSVRFFADPSLGTTAVAGRWLATIAICLQIKKMRVLSTLEWLFRRDAKGGPRCALQKAPSERFQNPHIPIDPETEYS
jgi:hypothetical protein